MKLYDLHCGQLFTLVEDPTQPPDIQHRPDTTIVYKLHNLDGMYSYITDTENNIYHFAAWTEVTLYEIK